MRRVEPSPAPAAELQPRPATAPAAQDRTPVLGLLFGALAALLGVVLAVARWRRRPPAAPVVAPPSPAGPGDLALEAELQELLAEEGAARVARERLGERR